MKFSILLNTRKRVEYLQNLLCSVQFKTFSVDDIEVLINYDDDDKETEEFSKRTFGISVKFYKNKRPNSLHTTINLLAKESKGQYLIGVNDDIEFLTNNWDSIILNEIKKFKDKNSIKDDIIYCKTSCTSVDHEPNLPYGSCPVVSKQAADSIGKFLYEEFLGLGGDASIYRVYAAIDRVVEVNEVKFDHLMHNTMQKVMSPDQTGKEMRQRSFAQNLDPTTFDISKEVDILRKHIYNN